MERGRCSAAVGISEQRSAVRSSPTEGSVKGSRDERLEMVIVIRSANEVSLQLERSHENEKRSSPREWASTVTYGLHRTTVPTRFHKVTGIFPTSALGKSSSGPWQAPC